MTWVSGEAKNLGLLNANVHTRVVARS